MKNLYQKIQRYFSQNNLRFFSLLGIALIISSLSSYSHLNYSLAPKNKDLGKVTGNTQISSLSQNVTAADSISCDIPGDPNTCRTNASKIVCDDPNDPSTCHEVTQISTNAYWGPGSPDTITCESSGTSPKARDNYGSYYECLSGFVCVQDGVRAIVCRPKSDPTVANCGSKSSTNCDSSTTCYWSKVDAQCVRKNVGIKGSDCTGKYLAPNPDLCASGLTCDATTKKCIAGTSGGGVAPPPGGPVIPIPGGSSNLYCDPPLVISNGKCCPSNLPNLCSDGLCKASCSASGGTGGGTVVTCKTGETICNGACYANSQCPASGACTNNKFVCNNGGCSTTQESVGSGLCCPKLADPPAKTVLCKDGKSCCVDFLQPPAQPAEFSSPAAVKMNCTDALISWGKSSDATSYSIEWYIDPSQAPLCGTSCPSVSNSIFTYTVKGLTKGQIYYFAVVAHSAQGTKRNFVANNGTTLNVCSSTTSSSTNASTATTPTASSNSTSTLPVPPKTATIPPAGDTATANISLAFTLPGIGGTLNNDNPSPKRSQRTANISLVPSSGNATSAQGSVTFDSSTNSYMGTLTASNLAVGTYTLKIRLDNTLWKKIPNSISLVQGTNNINATTVKLVSGDLDQDNSFTVADYTNFVMCYKSLASCTGSLKLLTDLNDNGNIDIFDLNILQRGFAVLNGD